MTRVITEKDKFVNDLVMVVVMFSIFILCYFGSHHSCFIYINCSAVAMVLDQERD